MSNDVVASCLSSVLSKTCHAKLIYLAIFYEMFACNNSVQGNTVITVLYLNFIFIYIILIPYWPTFIA